MNVIYIIKIVSLVTAFGLVVGGVFNLPFDIGFAMISSGIVIGLDATAWLIVIEKIQDLSKTAYSTTTEKIGK
jgi:hypothetical protein